MAQNGLQNWKNHHIHHHIRVFFEKTTDIFEKNMDLFEKNTDIFLKNRGYGEKKHGYLKNICGYLHLITSLEVKTMDFSENIRGFFLYPWIFFQNIRVFLLKKNGYGGGYGGFSILSQMTSKIAKCQN